MVRWLVLIVVALLVMPSAVMAQTSEPSIDGALDEIGVDWDAWAEKSYSIAGISFVDPFGYAFIGIDLSSEDDAATVIDMLPPVFNRMMSDSYGEGPIAFVRVSAGQVGDERYAASAEIESDDLEFAIGYVMARSGHFVVVGLVFGMMVAPVVEVAPFVESTLDRITDEDPQTWQELRELLPQLDDMPAGYTDDDDAPEDALNPSPTPYVTPTSTSPTSVHLKGNGTYKASRINVDSDTYRITFTCSAPTGSAEIMWGTQGTPWSLVTSTDHQDLRFYTLDAFAVASVTIECAGTWALDIMPA